MSSVQAFFVVFGIVWAVLMHVASLVGVWLAVKDVGESVDRLREQIAESQAAIVAEIRSLRGYV